MSVAAVAIVTLIALGATFALGVYFVKRKRAPAHKLDEEEMAFKDNLERTANTTLPLDSVIALSLHESHFDPVADASQVEDDCNAGIGQRPRFLLEEGTDVDDSDMSAAAEAREFRRHLGRSNGRRVMSTPAQSRGYADLDDRRLSDVSLSSSSSSSSSSSLSPPPPSLDRLAENGATGSEDSDGEDGMLQREILLAGALAELASDDETGLHAL